LKSSSFTKVFHRPDSEPEIVDLVEKMLRHQDVAGSLPTPIDQLFKAAEITAISELDDFEESFLARLKGQAKRKLKATLQKIRGIADLRERVVYIPSQNENKPRERFVKGHELGHQIIPWHNVDPTYLDDKHTLSPSVRDQFEQEANFFSAETLFQGYRFKEIALDYRASIEAVFKLKDMHATSFQTTLWQYVEVQDEIVAVAQYYPARAYDDHGNMVLELWKIVPSLKFSRKFGDIELPGRIRTGDPWVAARELSQIIDGVGAYPCGCENIKFQWQAFWNHYTLFIFLRYSPAFKRLGKIIHSSN